MSSIDEIKDLVTKTLEAKHVLGKIRAEIRAAVFTAIDEQEKHSGTYLENPQISKITATPEARVAVDLLREFLAFYQLDYTLSVLLPEADLPDSFEGRDAIAKRLGIKVDNKNSRPLIVELYEAFRKGESSNPTSSTNSPRSLPPSFHKNLLDNSALGHTGQPKALSNSKQLSALDRVAGPRRLPDTTAHNLGNPSLQRPPEDLESSNDSVDDNLSFGKDKSRDSLDAPYHSRSSRDLFGPATNAAGKNKLTSSDSFGSDSGSSPPWRDSLKDTFPPRGGDSSLTSLVKNPNENVLGGPKRQNNDLSPLSSFKDSVGGGKSVNPGDSKTDGAKDTNANAVKGAGSKDSKGDNIGTNARTTTSMFPDRKNNMNNRNDQKAYLYDDSFEKSLGSDIADLDNSPRDEKPSSLSNLSSKPAFGSKLQGDVNDKPDAKPESTPEVKTETKMEPPSSTGAKTSSLGDLPPLKGSMAPKGKLGALEPLKGSAPAGSAPQPFKSTLSSFSKPAPVKVDDFDANSDEERTPSPSPQDVRSKVMKDELDKVKSSAPTRQNEPTKETMFSPRSDASEDIQSESINEDIEQVMEDVDDDEAGDKTQNNGTLASTLELSDSDRTVDDQNYEQSLDWVENAEPNR